jgi:hypothetical protein
VVSTISPDYARLFPVTDEIMQPGCLSYCRQKAGFENWPTPGLVKQGYKPAAVRIQEGKEAFRRWLQTPEGAGCSYTLPATDDEDDNQEEDGGATVDKEETGAKKAKPTKRKNESTSKQASLAAKKPRKQKKEPIQAQAQDIELIELEEDEYAVEAIVGQRVNKQRGQPEYRQVI